MRIGNNPEKNNTILQIDSYHRVIIPIYIPNLSEDYFKDGLKILSLCIDSLLKTIHEKTRISLVDNGCCAEVVSYLNELYHTEPKVDQLLNSRVNLGKVNALYAIIKSNLEPVITISDADVMFLPNWQQEVETVLQNFPEAGMVSPVPSSKGYGGLYLNSTIYYGLFKGKIRFGKVQDPDGMVKFQESIGRTMYEPIHLEKYLTLENKKSKVVLGCGHFVATFRAEVFESGPQEVCQHKIVGGSENKYLDIPNDKAGYLRVATLGNYAYHLGNIHEKWMDDKMEMINSTANLGGMMDSLPKAKPLNKLQYLIGKVFHLLLFRKFKKFYFSLKGMKTSF
ncbi:MAG: glycosyltransferase family 2 protein [Flavobacteriaceae bacterium]|nr:glycosyltransferase family 2 protein [Flavobacteriaceae bacterium]